MTSRRTKNDSAFGASVSNTLAEVNLTHKANITQNSLAHKIGVSPSYLNQMMTGRKTPTPKWVDIVASTLKLQDDQRKKLHAAAAKDAGYDIDLTKE